MKPVIVCHRGFWKDDATRQNTTAAFSDAFDRGWGVELDVRDSNGRLVVSHDPPSLGEYPLPFSGVLELLGGRPNVLAVNVKSCGLAPMFKALTPPAEWFFFDMAVYDYEEYPRLGLPTSPVGFRVSTECYGVGYDHLPYWGQIKRAAVTNPDVRFLLVTDYPEAAEEFFQ